MDAQIPFLNFSLKKVLARQPDTLKKARIKIVYTILLLSIVKILVLLPLVLTRIHEHQLYRMLFILVFYLALAKYLLYKPNSINIISHFIVVTGIGAVWTNVFFFQQSINMVTIQFAFMVTFVGYYLIDSRFAVIYSILAIAPLLYYLAASGRGNWHMDVIPQELPSPGFEAIVAMNFITMLLIHYLFYCAFRDNVSEKEELNRQLQATVAETKALADSRSVFLSTMSHELRTPLNAVMGMASLVRDTATAEQTENLDILEFSAQSLLTMVNDILDYNKSENDRIELETIPVNLPVLMHRVCLGLQQKATEKGLTLTMDVDDQLKDKWLVTDPTRLTQIIHNLVGNALKFTERGGVSVKLHVTQADEHSVSTHFSVTDTGIGIADNRQEAIFDPFTQASADTTRHYGGTGLGLAIVKRLLKLFNSNIVLKSIAGEGSEFSFAIDFNLHKGIVVPASIHTGMNSSLEGLKILIAEDNPINALLLVKLLTKWKARSVLARNGSEAIEKLMTEDFDVVLMDLHMPIMDGYEATERIRQMAHPAKSSVVIIALTASVSHNIHSKIKAAGMHDYLSKPFQPTLLFQKLEPLQNALAPREILSNH
ncbi:ATP-binding protein [Mucilaginibacter psychrotolerans]|uniref:histidine kinase n=1 Tax=Mucilaginibacter psychrotolerans TaxID=1524096 RepID=A0A4Y8SCK9_9SPHI|nr:ATP-binding protein [Mucilaginibacter psychrotolerans]TFF36327.1 response regulator [Mucilaginibacter psychrotolerans]